MRNMMWATHCVSVHTKIPVLANLSFKGVGDVIFTVVATSEFKCLFHGLLTKQG